MAKPEWWNDEGLKALSARVVRVVPNVMQANDMRAIVLSGLCGSWAAGPRSAADLKKAATHKDRAAALHEVLDTQHKADTESQRPVRARAYEPALHPPPAGKAKLTGR